MRVQQPQSGVRIARFCSAGFQPAVSPTSSRQACLQPRRASRLPRPQVGNLRYSRLEACATAAALGCTQLSVAILVALLLSGCSTIQPPLAPAGAPASLVRQPGTAALLSPGDELWIVARGAMQPSGIVSESPSSANLLVKAGTDLVPMPLKHTEARATIRGPIGQITVVQQFANPYSRKIEALYTFPLPHTAAVNEFIMTIGDRHIRGIIRDRDEAQQIYLQAKRQGFLASLLNEERPNVFSAAVANIEPGREIDVSIAYFQTLDYVNGWYEFVLPTVVAPRFNRTREISYDQPHVRYLKPGQRTTHELSIKVSVDAGVPIEEFECPSHLVISQTPAPERLEISLQPPDNLPDKDFVLRYRVAGTRIKSYFLPQETEQGGFFTLLVYPPSDLAGLPRQPLDIVFVLDCSASMAGLPGLGGKDGLSPIEQAGHIIESALNQLEPADSFQVIAFSDAISHLADTPLEANPANVNRALGYLRTLKARGGAALREAIRAALGQPHPPEKLHCVCILTAGHIANERECLNEIHDGRNSARVFAIGLGPAPNHYLLSQIARAGHGAATFLAPAEENNRQIGNLFSSISHPAMTDLRVDWGGLHVTEVFPKQPFDLFVGHPVLLIGRFAGNLDTTIFINGTVGQRPMQIAIPAKLHLAAGDNGGNQAEVHNGQSAATQQGTPRAADGSPSPLRQGDGAEGERVGVRGSPEAQLGAVARSHEDNVASRALPMLWARAKIADLEERSYPDSEEIKRVALEYGLISPYTSFISTDSTHRSSSTPVNVPVAVPLPEGNNYPK
ncbi:MAG: hypothetical protein C5B50_03470 [Verrucomicrobia bacterium]|nr:MAG: hypothetical protein C5B50_03470 [Verrucomicrobiota bacterium]